MNASFIGRRQFGIHPLAWICCAVFSVAIFFYFVLPASGTMQIPDSIVVGYQTYSMNEIPMLGLWDFDKDGPAAGKEKPPPFQVMNSANWKGYIATFEIRDSKLWLKKIKGVIDDKSVKNDQIIAGKRFPIVAKWYSGRIHLGIGDFDTKTQEMTSVIIFHIDKGVVTKTEYADRMKDDWSWNGLPYPDDPKTSK